jgi:hypothetical protein
MSQIAQLDDGQTDVVVVGVGLVGPSRSRAARYQRVADRETVSAIVAWTNTAIV